MIYYSSLLSHHYRLSIFCAIFSLFFISISADPLDARQSNASVEFIQLFNALQEDLPRERIHLHTDRQWYFYGDRIWFSAYLTAGSYNQPSPVSRVIYVEIYSPDGDLIERTAVKNDGGRAKGSILVSHNHQGGMYKLKAYTAWSLNFPESYSFSENIPVYVSESELENEIQNNADEEFAVDFFPEGGQFVAEVENRVGFKALSSNGYGRDVSGVIYNQDDEWISDLKSEHLGMGSFNMTPEPGQSYYAIVENIRFELPEISDSQLALKISENEHNQYILGLNSTNHDYQSYLIFGHVRGEVYMASEIDVMDGYGFTVAPKSMFPTGPVHFTVLSDDGQPVAERLMFNLNSTDYITTELDSNKGQYGLRDRVDLKISLHHTEDTAPGAIASISVFDDKPKEFDKYASSIKTRFLLESDIEGHVESPGYYFTGDERSSRAADLLMLTQGWRAFDMKQVQQVDEISLFSMPEAGIMVEGQVQSLIRGRGLNEATVVFSMGNEHDELQILETGEDGNFYITELDFEGSQPISIRANDKDGNDNVRIRISEPYSHLPVEEIEINQAQFKLLVSTGPSAEGEETPSVGEIAERAVATQQRIEEFADVQMRGELDEVVVEAESEAVDSFESNLRLRDSGSQRIDLDERPELTPMNVESIVNQIPGVTANPMWGLQINTGSASLMNRYRATPLVILDGIETDWPTVRSISTSDIQTINVFRRATELAAFGSSGAGGVLYVRTRRGSGASAAPSRGFITAYIEGFQAPTRFYSPRYGINIPRDFDERDNRITLHWDPEMNLSNGEGQVSFWTNDIPSTYRIVLEGITDFGIPFTETVTFTVSD